MQKISHFHASPAYSVRSNLIFGLKLCALARTEGRVGSAVRAQELLIKAKRVVENASHHLHVDEEIPVVDRGNLGRLVDHLRASIGGLDPLWVPNSGKVPTRNDSDVFAA